MANLQATTVNGTVVSLKQENTTSTSKTLALTDRNEVVACTNTSAITITVPTDASVNFPIGSVVNIARVGTGTVTLAAASGVTLSKTGTLGLNEELVIRKRAANTWIVQDSEANLTATGGTLVANTSGFNRHTFTSTGSTNFVVS